MKLSNSRKFTNVVRSSSLVGNHCFENIYKHRRKRSVLRFFGTKIEEKRLKFLFVLMFFFLQLIFRTKVGHIILIIVGFRNKGVV